jgi:hypothetical protein
VVFVFIVACGYAEVPLRVELPPCARGTDPAAPMEGFIACKSRCSRSSDGEACYAAAGYTDTKSGVEYMLRACKLGVRGSCTKLAEWMRAACVPRVLDSCSELVVALEDACEPMPSRHDPCVPLRDAAEKVAQELCVRGDRACESVAKPLRNRCATSRPSPNACRGQAVIAHAACVRDDARQCVIATDPLKIACAKGSHDDCTRLDEALATNAAWFCPTQETDRSVPKRCEAACQSGNAEACMARAAMEGAPPRAEHTARTWFLAACDRSEGRRGCLEYARFLAGDEAKAGRRAGRADVFDEDGTPRRAVDYYAKACRGRVAAACAWLVDVVAKQKRDAPAPAVDAARRLCSEGRTPEACAGLAAAGL